MAPAGGIRALVVFILRYVAYLSYLNSSQIYWSPLAYHFVTPLSTMKFYAQHVDKSKIDWNVFCIQQIQLMFGIFFFFELNCLLCLSFFHMNHFSNFAA